MPDNSTSKTPATPPVTMPTPSSGTGLDHLVTLITQDSGLLRCAGAADTAAGAAAADAMNVLLVQAIRATGVANNGDLTPADLYAVNDWIRGHQRLTWITLHGDDEGDAETGFHLVQNDGARSRLFGRNAVDTVADGIYHLGFEICDGQVLNEDGDPNASLKDLSSWLGKLLAADLAAGTLANAAVDPTVKGSTGTGLDQLVDLVSTDAGLQRMVSLADIQAGARAADAMGTIIVSAIRATGVANNGDISRADLRDVNSWIRSHAADTWATLHGDDECEAETGFHRVQDDGATTRLFGRNAVDTVADGIYHLGFEICDDQVLNEDGAANATLKQLSGWLNQLLATDLAGSTLDNTAVDPYAHGTTGTGLDQLVNLITADAGLDRRIATSQIHDGALAADAMNGLIVQAIRATGAADGHSIDVDDVRAINAWLRSNQRDTWALLHGDDEDGHETGFHRVQDDGATTRLFGRNAVDTVADGIYHLGFAIEGGHLLNEDGMANASLRSVSTWLNDLLAADLASGSLDATVPLVGVAG